MIKSVFLFVVVLTMLSACGGGSGDNSANGGNGNNQNTVDLQNEIDNLFPFTLANKPIDMIFQCQRVNSSLVYYFDFKSNGVYDILATLNNNNEVTVSGTYTYQNDEIHMQSSNAFLPMDERTTAINPKMGLIESFSTPSMQCVIYGHRYNSADVSKNYQCPTIVSAVSQEENAVEFILPNGLPFNLPVPGAVFRQRDVYVSGSANPIIAQGYGIYRRIGNTYYADFGSQFDDVNLIKGEFLTGDTALSVEQLDDSVGNCTLR